MCAQVHWGDLFGGLVFKSTLVYPACSLHSCFMPCFEIKGRARIRKNVVAFKDVVPPD